ncbi:MAG TPA: hypothetical protein VNI83_16215 [Vicinamibacterales bacterium]|nr:hypothetical protein [Vicinamibacterales bacterium]
MRHRRLAILAALAVAVLAGLLVRALPRGEHEILREVYQPRFAPVPAPAPAADVIAGLRDHLTSPEGQARLRRWLPSQSGVLWLALLTAIVAGFDFERLRNPRNLDLLLIQGLGFLFYDILSFGRRLHDPQTVALLFWIFGAIFFVSLALAARALWHAVRPIRVAWRPPLGGRALAAVALLMVALDVAAAALRPPDDSGYFVNLGAQRLRERGLLPYGDPLLTGTPGAAYGPLLYVAHVPFQLLVDPARVNPVSSPRPPLGAESTYRLPSPLATKLCTIAFQVLAVASLYLAARRFASRDTAWALVALYAGSAFVLGVGGDDYFIGGMTFVSHIGPPAVTTAAFAALVGGQAALAGILLVAAAGCGFYPAFLLPAWAGFLWDRRRERRRFLLAVAGSAALLAAFVLLCSRPAGGRSLVGTILWDTFGHHSDPAGYGSSPFGFWGQRGGLRAWLMRPLAGDSGLTAPALLIFFAVAGGGFALARRRPAPALALVSAAVVIGANLIKVHATGTYVAWFYPFLLLGWFLPVATTDEPPEQARAVGSARMSASR